MQRCKIEDIVEGYKGAIDEIRGAIAKKGIFGPKSGPMAGKRPAEQPNGHLLGAWGQFFSEYRQVGYPERRNDMP